MDTFRKLDFSPKRVFVIGDIHGCADELHHLLEFIKKEERFGPRDLLVCIGDYIDRGIESKTVVTELLEHQKSFPNTVFLKGNHEDMLLNFLGYDGSMAEAYLANGGIETLRSYGLSAYKTQREVLDDFPKDHLNFFLNLDRGLILDNFICVHAGLNPLKELDEQTDKDLFWIREDFIANTHHFGKTVIFGHTPYHEVFFNLPYKIGIDTGAVYGQKLSCVELIGGKVFEVENGETDIKTYDFPKSENS